MNLSNPIISLPIYFLIPPAIVAFVLGSTYILTTLRYYFAIFLSSKPSSNAKYVLHPLPLPYTIPWMGQGISFLAPAPGRFWDRLRAKLPTNVQACTLQLVGQTMYIVFSPVAVQALFKKRELGRRSSNVRVLSKACGMSLSDCKKFYTEYKEPEGADTGTSESAGKIKLTEEAIYLEFLLQTTAVKEITNKFLEVFVESLRKLELAGSSTEWQEVDIYEWLKPLMFKASTTALFGSNILEMYPDLGADFFVFDAEFLSMLFGVPKYFKPDGYRVRPRLLEGIAKWSAQSRIGANGENVLDSKEWWEPKFGSRFIRQRQKLYDQKGLSGEGRACPDLGLLFGVSSNAIPASGWILYHLLADQDLLKRVMLEVETAQELDGTLDIQVLMQLPLLQSVFQETLRFYVDTLVSRELIEDLVLPSERGQLLLKKNSHVLVPSWMGHRDAEKWMNPSASTFYPERFLKEDPESGKLMFSITGAEGKLFPWGGGKHICPGRVFAKQEILVSVASIILGFEFEFKGYVDEKGLLKAEFPSLRKGYTGNGIMAMDGDVRVRMRRR